MLFRLLQIKTINASLLSYAKNMVKVVTPHARFVRGSFIVTTSVSAEDLYYWVFVSLERQLVKLLVIYTQPQGPDGYCPLSEVMQS